MADIVLKDRNGKDIIYPGINSIRLKTADGDTREFVNGETAEKTVAPDFSSGNVEVVPDAGTFLNKVTIEKPKDLLPKNIRDGTEIGGVVGSAFVVETVETVVLEENTYDGFEEIEEGAGIYILPMEFLLTVGETYRIVWGTNVFVITAGLYQGAIPYVGNLGMVGLGDDTGEPFLIVTEGGTSGIFTTDMGSHYIGISQKTRGDVETADVELSLSDGDQEVTPSASDKVLTKVTIKKPATLIPENIAKNVNVAGVVGTLAAETEEATVNLNFSNGAMEVLPTGEKTFSKVNIPVPETLIPENIAEGVNIAGIIGALAAGGGGAKVEFGTVSGNGGRVTKQHTLGVIPDMIIVTQQASLKTPNLMFACGFSKAMTAVFPSLPKNMFATAAKFGNTSNQNYEIDGTALTDTYVYIKATETDFSVGNSSYPLPNYITYHWLAIAGLT